MFKKYNLLQKGWNFTKSNLQTLEDGYEIWGLLKAKHGFTEIYMLKVLDCFVTPQKWYCLALEHTYIHSKSNIASHKTRI